MTLSSCKKVILTTYIIILSSRLYIANHPHGKNELTSFSELLLLESKIGCGVSLGNQNINKLKKSYINSFYEKTMRVLTISIFPIYFDLRLEVLENVGLEPFLGELQMVCG